MSQPADRILASLRAVDDARAERANDEALRLRVQAVKAYQQRRFERTYDDLLHDERYAPASRFFLEELYGPSEFSDRDAQFARIVPALVRLFPPEIVETVAGLAALHALSESLDSEMGRRVASADVDRTGYAAAWQATGRAADRERQIALTLDVGRDLARYTRRPVLRQSLRMMRTPARVAGLSDLQRFLETGFDTFAVIGDATDFLAVIGERERALATALFASRAGASEAERNWLDLLPKRERPDA